MSRVRWCGAGWLLVDSLTLKRKKLVYCGGEWFVRCGPGMGAPRMRAGSAPRAPRWGHSTPPDPLQMMLVARSQHRHMVLVCSDLDHHRRFPCADCHARLTFPNTITSFWGSKGQCPWWGCRGSAPDRPLRRRPALKQARASPTQNVPPVDEGHPCSGDHSAKNQRVNLHCSAGSNTVNVVPAHGLLLTAIVPWCISIIFWAIERPNPLPPPFERVRDLSAL